jgi:hypothetical protein
VAAIVVLIYWHGPVSIALFGRAVSLYPPSNLLTLAYALLFVRMALIWRDRRGELETVLGVPGRALLCWHMLPIAVSFLIPKRLGTFVWFVSPLNAQMPFDLIHGLRLYWGGFSEGFVVSWSLAVAVLLLTLVGLTQLRALALSARTVLVLAFLSLAAVLLHPQHQARFLTNWIFSIWIAAGLGVATLIAWLTSAGTRRLRIVVAAVSVTAFVAMNVLVRPSPNVREHAIRAGKGPTDLDLMRPYIAELDNAREIMVAPTFGTSQLFAWMLRERQGRRVLVTRPWIMRSERDSVRRQMADAIASTKADVIVVIEDPGDRYALPILGWVSAKMAGIPDAMAQQTRYHRVSTHHVASHGTKATIWRKR